MIYRNKKTGNEYLMLDNSIYNVTIRSVKEQIAINVLNCTNADFGQKMILCRNQDNELFVINDHTQNLPDSVTIQPMILYTNKSGKLFVREKEEFHQKFDFVRNKS